ncbi:MAG: ADP-ribosylation factor-like protein [Candidatus Thorarchaeota archaeon]
MIHNVFLMTREGRIAFHRQYWSVDISAEERQEFLATYKHFESELGSQVDLPIHVKNIKFLYTDVGTHFLLVFAVDISDEDVKIKESLKKTRDLLIKKYGNEIDSYIQKPVPAGQAFEGLAKELDNVIVTMLKICLLGQGGVGKSTMLKLLTADSIPGDYYPTIAVDIETLQGVRFGPYELAVWDFAGQDRFRSLWNYYLRNADAVLLITDSTLKNVLETRDILEIIRKNAPSSIVWAIGNKQDLPGALAPKLVQRILGVQAYGLVAIDPRYREVLYKIILGAVAEATTD